MVDVKFTVDAVGVPKVKADLRSIADLARDQQVKIQNLHQNTAQRLKEIDRDYANNVKRLSDQSFKNEEEKMRRLADLHRRFEEQKLKISERQQLRQQQIAEQIAERQGSRLNLGALGQFLGATGMPGVGHVMRGLSQMGIGANLSLGAVAGIGAAAVALGGVVVAAKLVESAFQQTAGAFLGAMTEIGKARNIQAMIVEAATNEKTAATARFAVTPEERTSNQQLRRWAANQAGNPAFGHSAQDWLQGAAQFGTDTGLQKSLITNPGLSSFAGMISHSSGTTPAQTLHMLGLLQSQNPNMSSDQIQNIMLSAIGIGQHGAFNWAELAQTPELFTQVSKLGGDPSKAYTSTFAVASLLKKRTGNLGESSTEVGALIKALDTAHRGGTNYGSFKAGSPTNLAESLAIAAAHNPDLVAHPFQSRIEAITGLQNLRGQAGVTDTDTFEQAKKKIYDMIKAEEDHKMSLEELTVFNQESITSQDRLTSAFNRISATLESQFLTELERGANLLDTFVKSIADNKDPLSQAFHQIITVSEQMIPVLASLGLIMVGLLSVIAPLAAGIAMIPLYINKKWAMAGLRSEQSTANDLFTKLEKGGLTPQEEKEDRAKLKDLFISIRKNETAITADNAANLALGKLPDLLQNAGTILGNMIGPLTQAIKDNTDAHNDSGTPTVQTREPNGT